MFIQETLIFKIIIIYILKQIIRARIVVFILPLAQTGSDWLQTIVSILSIIISSLLSFAVIQQAKYQNRINKKLLDSSLGERLGYFTPRSIIEIGGRKVDYYHNLDEGVELDNTGEDCVFIFRTDLVVCGKKKDIPLWPEVFFSNEYPHNRLIYTCHLTNEEINQPIINMEITLFLKNMKGYRYKEVLFLSFEKAVGTGNPYDFRLCKFNMHLEGVEQYAD